ncbi:MULTISPECIES: glycosyltransferase family 4 protein [Streptomyces]|uniref:glycosyltransferase family 4 protein n=6 Tax=Streptomyces scabiei TaxID=1930 RepID=UPI0004E6E78E|nr:MULTISPECIES: glycosyltransferase family 1 protein [Streptomyces]MBP5904890.1 glycosyltransferase family 1 protein [Streptomyces sp. LBUM 1478]MBP5932886.1 glycosyltransferase family 1 protein [Streptomyces sp. LBUM 1479]KFG07591.1 glycosyl transferase family 1 [Streptomyces scabiei]MBP5918169.1 glycosyltransferase family 1 protein [Streptomyces sp. LBUM 1486]MDX2539367.1 glycosyltransferase family 1 protein [Streptomyces scabiei]
MRVVIVTESFPPDVNGVAHCALQTARHLVARGHSPLVVAPATAQGTGAGADLLAPCPVVRVPSLPLPGYPQVRVALPSRRVAAAIVGHRADIVHLASPFVLGVRGMAAAARLGVPAVAIYQTDLAGYARTYVHAGEAAAWRRIRAVHAAADRTLAPSTAALRDLRTHGVPRVSLWPRGVDTVRFRPQLRDQALRRALAPGGEPIVGYVGRLAPEKQIELLAGVCARGDVKVVIVGDGPSEPALRAALPGAVFLGRRTGDELARIFASLDVFVHTGPYETFCQTVQEAMASGVPVVAPAAGGPLDLVDHGRTGLLVPPRDPAAVRDAVLSLAADPELRARYGAAGRAMVEGRTWAAVGDRLIEHYTDVLATRTEVAA